MVSPSATPITLPDQAQAGQGSTRKKIRTSQTIEKPLFIASQPTPLSTATTKITKKSIARAVPEVKNRAQGTRRRAQGSRHRAWSMGHRVIKGQVYTRLDQLLCMILAPSTGLSSLNLKVNLGMVQSEEPILRGYQ